MEFLVAGFSSLISIFVMAMIGFGVSKLFQIHTVLGEIRDALRVSGASSRIAEHQRSAPPVAAASSGEDMLRALDAQIKLDQFESLNTAQRGADRE
jgi:hypothetical protein